uniref:uncharacterized protein LOC120330726 n=1 Tax=Styela clava TaxID=7725 RepID=UPI00193A3297|nr:uncharacterized protein LOC120330726 [Styela clava]
MYCNEQFAIFAVFLILFARAPTLNATGDCVVWSVNNTDGLITVPDEQCGIWEFESLHKEQTLFLRLEEMDLQYTATERVNTYCNADVIIAGNNYCYFEPGTCLVSGVRELNDYLQIDSTHNCTSIVWMKSSNISIKFKRRLKNGDPRFKLQFNITVTNAATTRSTVTTMLPDISTVSTPENTPYKEKQTGPGVEVEVVVVLGVLLLISFIILGFLLFRMHRKGLIKTILFGERGQDLVQVEEVKDDQPDAITVYSAMQRPSRDHDLPMSSERQIVVNELYSL